MNWKKLTNPKALHDSGVVVVKDRLGYIEFITYDTGRRRWLAREDTFTDEELLDDFIEYMNEWRAK